MSAHRDATPRRPRSGLFTCQRLRCPKGSYIGKRGEGWWWVRSPANSRTRFSEGQKDDRTIGTESLEPFEPLRGGASGGPKDPLPIISVLELTSPDPLRPPADGLPPRWNRAGRVVPTRGEFSPLGRRGPQLREVTGVGRGITVRDRSAWEINLKSMVFETRLKPGPTKAKRYRGAS